MIVQKETKPQGNFRERKEGVDSSNPLLLKLERLLCFLPLLETRSPKYSRTEVFCDWLGPSLLI